jgi:hypothetical protein
MRARRLLVPVIAALTLAAAAPSVAVAGTPCWQRVINDWAQHNGIKGHYSPACLRQAIKYAPTDLADYSGLIDDIYAALIGSTHRTHKNGTNNASSSNQGGSGSGGGPGGGGSSSGGGGNGNGTGKGAKIVPHAGTPASAPAHSRSIPLPLIILAAVLAAAALAAGSPQLIKRFRGHFPRPQGAAQQSAAKP